MSGHASPGTSAAPGSDAVPLGFGGRVARAFYRNQLTPLLGIFGLLLGLFAVLVTPREEEPQIEVTFANVIIPFPGASAAQVESLAAAPMERVLGEISDVKHVYAVSRPGSAVLTVEFEVGIARNEALVRLYNAIYSNRDWRPPGLGIGEPLVKPRGIDDVPVVTLTLWTADPARGGAELALVARSLEEELKRIRGTRNVYSVGAPERVVHVQLDPARLAGHGLTATELLGALRAANVVTHAGSVVGEGGDRPVTAGEFLAGRDDVAELVIGLADGRPVYLSDVAAITDGADQPEQYVWFGAGPAAAQSRIELAGESPAVTIAVSKQPGTNAVDVTSAVNDRVERLRGTVIPDGVEVTVTRDYGLTANDKAQKLIQKLAFATACVVLLVAFALGWREAVVVGAAVLVTLAITLFASWAWGFTINRVSLFALIFSIGILVDDAIVVVENIHRHMAMGGRSLLEAIPPAVDEVGGPTILATFTVIAALLPMAFVSGLMGPYMSPIPINASLGMLISLAVALVLTPWMAMRLLGGGHGGAGASAGPGAAMPVHAPTPSALDRALDPFFRRVMAPFLAGSGARRARHRLYLGTLVAILAAVSMAGLQWVVLKMLPFDDKSEFQVVLHMPEGAAVEDTARVLGEMAAVIREVPEVTDWQAYAGTAAPINFNGLVRQYYLRRAPELGDLQVNLVDKAQRDRASHDIARAVRPAVAAIAERHGARVQIVEVPPGPPVMAPLVAEVYGPDYEAQRRLARELERAFRATPDVVDTDTTAEADSHRYVVAVDRVRAARLGVSQAAVAETLALGLGGLDATFVHVGREQAPIPVRLELPVGEKAALDRALLLTVRAASGARVPLTELVAVERVPRDPTRYRKDGLPVVFVFGDEAGRLDSPLYGMFALVGAIGDGRAPLPSAGGVEIDQYFISQPLDTTGPAIKWDGEWQITYETFRDMGAAYAVGLVFIYLLVVAQFRSYAVPLVIMAPIPLTMIGIMPGHALLGAQFTATSMIGMIALAGIIVRNSILLVDFVNQELAAGRELPDAVIRAGAVRAKPIALTGLAAMLGAVFILDDPIFNGLAVSLIFGILVSTILTLVVIPILYYGYLRRRAAQVVESATSKEQYAR
ncbi:MAG: efflux RND transporter permease subunit [Steroidobacteraceae bacterium]|nr:efflux RND transporter permease subunit [Steroidobacteraceae bacterium]